MSSPKERCAAAREFVRGLQDSITTALNALDGKAEFREDLWTKETGRGGGRTRVIRDGAVFEQGGVNWSEVYAERLPPTILAKYPQLKDGPTKFYVTGTSMVLHPRSPHIPTVHMNYRFFEVGDVESDEERPGNVWWFGGGMDLTPYYVDQEDFADFHGACKAACDKHHADFHKVFKAWADSYFYLKHRQENRGIGGLFFDYMDGKASSGDLYRPEKSSFEYSEASAKVAAALGPAPEMSFAQLLAFAQDCGAAFLPTYTKIVQKHRNDAVTEAQRQWQLYRRGRYVEFNLVYDRGTVFGLQSGGRTESILMSLPPQVRFEYAFAPAEGTPEYEMWQVNLHAKDWV